MGKDEIMSAIRYGADDIFKQEGDADEEIDIDAILQKAEARTDELNKKFEDAKKDGLSSSMWTFGGEDFDPTDRFGQGAGFIDIGKRDRKATSYSEQAYFKNLDTTTKDNKPKIHRAKEVQFFDYQARSFPPSPPVAQRRPYSIALPIQTPCDSQSPGKSCG